MRQHISIPKAALLGSFVAALALVFPIGAPTSETALALGGHAIGEKLSEFKAKLPSAVCESPLRAAAAEVSANASDILNNSDVLSCCVNDPKELAALSPFRILFAGKCGAYARFYRERLIKLEYSLDVESMDEILPAFTKAYGPAGRTYASALTSMAPISINTMVGWVRGHDALDLTLTSVRGKVLNADPSLNKGRAELKFIVVTLYGQNEVGGQ